LGEALFSADPPATLDLPAEPDGEELSCVIALPRMAPVLDLLECADFFEEEIDVARLLKWTDGLPDNPPDITGSISGAMCSFEDFGGSLMSCEIRSRSDRAASPLEFCLLCVPTAATLDLSSGTTLRPLEAARIAAGGDQGTAITDS
jgi:hypothetical protein